MSTVINTKENTMNPEQLNQFIQENPILVLALLEMIMQMDEQQLRKFVEALQQLAQEQQGGPEGEPMPEDGMEQQEQANSNLFA